MSRYFVVAMCFKRQPRWRRLQTINSFKVNPKRFWSVLKQTFKSGYIPDRVSMPSSPTTTSSNGKRSFLNQAHIDQSNLSSRPIATNPTKIADFFNTCFASVFISENLPEEHLNATVDPDFLKKTATIIAPSICKLFNKPLQQGTVPLDWKLANVVPNVDKEYTENYRPISLLPIISKVLER